MKITYLVMYKNGKEDTFEQVVTDENQAGVLEINKAIREGLKENRDGLLSFGDGEKEGSFVRLSDVVRVSMKFEK